uniref:Outer dynein arm-docking complex subunit 4 n=1 Tax=Equus asinus asinus TaxID=83772 RepID=A0A8C4LQA6_EQUAS
MVAALQSHRKDLEIAKEYDLPDAKSRALDNIGRVFARVGKFQQAIDTWEEKIPLAKTTLEKTWLFHEIGRCYLELDQPWQAQNYGEKSQQCAEEEGDIEWQLNASVLVAQAQVKLRDFESAVNNFEKALERAKLVHNNEAQQAIISVSLPTPLGPGCGEQGGWALSSSAFSCLLVLCPGQASGQQGRRQNLPPGVPQSPGSPSEGGRPPQPHPAVCF